MISKEFSNILKKYEKQKLNTYRVVEILGTDYTFNDYGADCQDKRYMALVECGTQLHFSKDTSSGKSVYHLTGANFCRQRLCPMCQFRKSEKMFAQMLQVVKALENDYRFIHVVFTIPNSRDGSELITGIKVLYKAYNTLMNRKKAKMAFKGALRCLEISYNYDNDTFHPHLHCLIAVRPSYFNDTRVYFSRDELMRLWTHSVEKVKHSFDYSEYITTNDVYQVYVRACKQNDYEGVAEVCKYCLKPLQLDDSRLEEQHKRILLTLWHTLKNQRFVAKFGIVKDTFNRLFGDDEDDDLSLDNPATMFIEWNCVTMNYERGLLNKK